MSDDPPRPYSITGLSYVSLYFERHTEAIDFYSSVLGRFDFVAPGEEIHGWKMGPTWLTIFPAKLGTAKDRGPCNVEFAIPVADKDDVDRLHGAFLRAGAKTVMEPQDTWMYEPMRFACVDDPFGTRIDVLCALPGRDDLTPQNAVQL